MTKLEIKCPLDKVDLFVQEDESSLGLGGEVGYSFLYYLLKHLPIILYIHYYVATRDTIKPIIFSYSNNSLPFVINENILFCG